jgi:flagellar hook-length control protein FliK
MDVEQLDILDQVTEKLEVSLFDNKSEMVIKLKPNDLGNVTVKISIENGVMNAKFLADSIKVKETLESSLNNLKESLKEQGLNVQDLNVSVDSGRSQNQTFEQSNLRYFNNKEEYKSDNTINYEDTYYEFSNINTNNIKNYWMDSTVSFLA